MSLNTVLKLNFALCFTVIMPPSQDALQSPLQQGAEKNASTWLITQKGATLRMEHVTVSVVT